MNVYENRLFPRAKRIIINNIPSIKNCSVRTLLQHYCAYAQKVNRFYWILF